MKTLGRAWKLLAAAGFCAALFACSEDEQALGDQCPNLPLYHYVSDGTTWKPVLNDGGALSAADLKAIVEAQQSDRTINGSLVAGRCVTPAGTAVTIVPGVDAGNAGH